MSFKIDFGAMLSTLPVMLYGMIGALVVMLVICGILTLLYRIAKSGSAE